MLDCLSIIQRYYTPGNDDYLVLVSHSRQVADLAVKLSQRLMDCGTPIDIEFVEEAAMLHDIGIFLTDAPRIYCFGTEPYIRHGLLGAELVRKEGYPRHALVCERHTGAGISLADINQRNLPLPQQDMLPVSLEEQVICFADKFFSKTRLEHEKTVEEARRSLLKFGDEGLERFDKWCKDFL